MSNPILTHSTKRRIRRIGPGPNRDKKGEGKNEFFFFFKSLRTPKKTKTAQNKTKRYRALKEKKDNDVAAFCGDRWTATVGRRRSIVEIAGRLWRRLMNIHEGAWSRVTLYSPPTHPPTPAHPPFLFFFLFFFSGWGGGGHWSILIRFSGRYWVVTEFSLKMEVVLGWCSVLLGFTGFYLVLQGHIRFLVGFT